MLADTVCYRDAVIAANYSLICRRERGEETLLN